MNDKIEIEDVQRLNVQPGETLLVTVPSGLSTGELDRIRQRLAELLPGVEVLVKTADVSVEVVSAEQRIADAVAEATANPGRTVEVKE